MSVDVGDVEDTSLVDIDPHRLDEEWLGQPGLVFKYGKALAKATRRLLDAKAAVKVTEAEVATKIRADPAKYKVDKITDKAVEIRVLLSKAVQEAVEEQNAAQEAVDMLKAAVNALEDRKKALENMVVLHGRDYFSQPRVREQADREVIEEAKKDKAFGRKKVKK